MPPTQGPDLDRPLVLVGPLRSGTTFLGLMLRHHPLIHHFGEFEEGFDLVENVNEGWPTGDAYRDWLSTFRVFRERGQTATPRLDYPDQVRDLAKQMAAKATPEQRVLGFTVHTGLHRVVDIWPNARFIHLLRDPRDVARSCIGMGWVGHVYYGTDYWLGPEQRWDRLRAKLRDDQFVEVRYEDIVVDAETQLRKICDLAEIDYDPAMLRYDSSTTYSKPDPSLAEQWKRKQTKREVQLAEHRLGPMLEDRGYTNSGFGPHTPGALENLRLLLTHRRKRLAFSINRYGFLLWTEWKLSRLLPITGYRKSVQLRVNRVAQRHLK
ncbi:MAG: sulfotransferase [Planctomycetota bacterium]